MPARTPDEVPSLFAQAFAAHDLESVMVLYEPQAALVPQPGETVTGTKAIREALSDFFATEPAFDPTSSPNSSYLTLWKYLATQDGRRSFAWTTTQPGNPGGYRHSSRRSSLTMRHGVETWFRSSAEIYSMLQRW